MADTPAPEDTATPEGRRAGVSTTSTPATRLLGIVTLAGVGLLLLLALVISPADVNQGESVRFLYIHVSSVWVAYLAFIVNAVGCGMYLFRRTHSLGWDRLAGASAEVGVLFMAITLGTGMLWGRLTWGVFWTWDARLTSTAFLFVMYLGYLAVRQLDGTREQRARRSAIVGLLAVLVIPLVHFSVTLWRSLHQDATVTNPSDGVEIEGLMLFTWMFGAAIFMLMYLWLVIHRQRVLALDDALGDRDLQEALAARRAEAAAVVGGQ